LSRQKSVAVIGGGSWGTTVASLAARNVPTILWSRRPEVAEEIERDHVNSDYLPGEELHPELRATCDLQQAVAQADVLVMAVPSHGFRDVLAQAAPDLRAWIPIVSLTKGLEPGTHYRMTEVIEELLPGHPAGVLAGPNLSKEVIGGFAAAAVLAMPEERLGSALQGVFSCTAFRVYSGTDVCGVEIAGALKNVFAIAAGMAAGLGTGDNTRALVIARSLAEMARLGIAMGGERHTFAGLAGMGDLLATCISPKAVMELSARHDVEMPIAREVYLVVNEGRTAAEAFAGLLRTRPTTELAAN
jgi:glycerol-3-phosphate dehydrogenase (NAD(P)+)